MAARQDCSNQLLGINTCMLNLCQHGGNVARQAGVPLHKAVLQVIAPDHCRYLCNQGVQALLPDVVLLLHDPHCLSCLIEGAQVSAGHAACLQPAYTEHSQQITCSPICCTLVAVAAQTILFYACPLHNLLQPSGLTGIVPVQPKWLQQMMQQTRVHRPELATSEQEEAATKCNTLLGTLGVISGLLGSDTSNTCEALQGMAFNT